MGTLVDSDILSATWILTAISMASRTIFLLVWLSNIIAHPIVEDILNLVEN